MGCGARCGVVCGAVFHERPHVRTSARTQNISHDGANARKQSEGGDFLFPICCHDPIQLLYPLCAPCGHSRPRRPEPLFRAPCTCGCRLHLRTTASCPPHDTTTTPPGVCIRTPRRMRPQDPSASRLRRKTEDPALLPPSRRPHAAVNIYPFAHTWSLPLTTRPTHSRPAYLPTARNTANVPRNMPVRTCLLRRRRTRVPHSCPRHTILSRR